MARGRISPELIQTIKAAVNLIDVVGEHVVLKGNRGNFTGLCPFHQERSPSFSVNESKQLYHCYGCKRGGDLVSFVMELHGVSFAEAIEELAERSKVALPSSWAVDVAEGSEEAKRSALQREKQLLAFRLNRFSSVFFRQQLAKFPDAEAYVRKRGLSAESERNYYVGAAQNQWDALARHLTQSKAPMDVALELGLIQSANRPREQSDVPYIDLFRDRVMFPIVDLRGRVVGFGGRQLSTEPGGPKYLNSKDSAVFQKSKVTYGLYQAQREARATSKLIVVEGYFDVLALVTAGFSNTVATCGTALTVEHLHLFKRLVEQVVILFDADRAGVEATDRAMEIGLDQGWVLYGASISGGKDPDEVLFHAETGKPLPEGKAKMEELLSQAKPLLDQKIGEGLLEARLGNEEKTRVIKRFSGWLKRFQDPVGREIRLEQVCQELQIQRSLLGFQDRAQVRPVAQSQGQSRNINKPKQFVPRPLVRPAGGISANAHVSEQEKLLFEFAIVRGAFPQLLEEAKSHLPSGMDLADLFQFAPARQWVREQIDTQEPPDLTNLESLNPQIRELILQGTVGESPLPEARKVRWTFLQALRRVWAQFSHKIDEGLSRAESEKNQDLQALLMKDYLDVQRRIKQLTKFYDEV